MKTSTLDSAPPRVIDSEVIDLVPLTIRASSILVPIDFSDTSKKALRYAIPFARQFGAKITLLHVIEPSMTAAMYSFPAQIDDAATYRQVEDELDRLAYGSLAPELLNTALVRRGIPFEVIDSTARALHTDLIIIATHGYTGLKHALLGSTAEHVVREAPCPVLVVRKHEHEFA